MSKDVRTKTFLKTHRFGQLHQLELTFRMTFEFCSGYSHCCPFSFQNCSFYNSDPEELTQRMGSGWTGTKCKCYSVSMQKKLSKAGQVTFLNKCSYHFDPQSEYLFPSLFLQTLPEVVTPLMGHSLYQCSCSPTLSASSESFGYQ